MSSSAALECATAFALNQLFGLGLDPLTMVKLSQKAENVFVGVQCGIMDQFASMFGRKHHVIRLDCQTLDYAYVPFNTEGLRIVLLDTNVKHSLASSEYNTRRQQCEAGVALVRAAGGIVTTLAGDEWTLESRSALAAAPGVHAQLLEMLQTVGQPDEY